MEILFLRHRCKDKNYSKIYTKITYRGERIEIGSTNIKILSDDWDVIKKRVAHTDPHASQKNEILTNIEADIWACYNDLLRKKIPFTVRQLKEAILKVGSGATDEPEPSMIVAMDKWLVAIENSQELSAGTKTKYRNVRDSFLNFLIQEGLLNVKLSEFSKNKMLDFRKWMSTKMKYKAITIHKRCQVVKQAMDWAAENIDACEVNPLASMSFKEPEPEEMIYLTEEQFLQLKNHKFRTQAKQEVADVFVIYCRTGFHYADLRDIINNHAAAVKTGINGKQWLHKARQKTSVVAKVPYFEEVEEILQKYGGWDKIPLKANATMNDYLKLIAEELNFPEKLCLKLSVKAGRKTLTDWLLNVKGWTVDAVKVLLGIRNSRYVEHYGKADERRVILEMERTEIH